MRISDWSSDVCSSDLARGRCGDGHDRRATDHASGVERPVDGDGREGVQLADDAGDVRCGRRWGLGRWGRTRADALIPLESAPYAPTIDLYSQQINRAEMDTSPYQRVCLGSEHGHPPGSRPARKSDV